MFFEHGFIASAPHYNPEKPVRALNTMYVELLCTWTRVSSFIGIAKKKREGPLQLIRQHGTQPHGTSKNAGP